MRVVVVTCTCTYVLLVCVDVCGYGKASGNPIRIEAPGGLMEKKERTTDQPRPEYRMSGIFISRCHSWKVASFSGKFFCRRHRIDTRCMTRHVKSELSASRIENQMLRRNLNVLRTKKNYFATISIV